MTNNTKANNARTREAHDAYVANRKEAGRVIDIETCEMADALRQLLRSLRDLPLDDDPPDELNNAGTMS